MRKSTKGEAMQSDILYLLHGADQAMSAYDILAVLRKVAPRLAPMTVYRALKTLCANGQVLRIESLNAYAPRQTEDTDGPVILSICDKCGALRETVAPEVLVSLTRMARQSGIEPTHHVVEIHGQCSDCGTADLNSRGHLTAPDEDRKQENSRGIHDQ